MLDIIVTAMEDCEGSWSIFARVVSDRVAADLSERYETRYHAMGTEYMLQHIPVRTHPLQQVDLLHFMS